MPKWIEVKDALGQVRGLRQEDVDAIARHSKWVAKLECGEYWTVGITRDRSSRTHKKFFKMVAYAFEIWPGASGRTYKGHAIAKEFESFRRDLLVLAGYGQPIYHLDGSISFHAPSVSYEAMPDEEQFRKVYDAVHKVILDRILTNYTGRDLERVLTEVDRFGIHGI